ncbi:MAG: YifB family Mg chelatase-like AAA ATPase [Patescibacteria group bacterium]|jgi:magnesium chelatase family protein
MMTHISSGALHGIRMEPVDVEVDVAGGLPAVYVVGLPDAGVQEARERIRAALHAAGGVFPRTRVTINLAPADSIKRGPHFDLPIALALAAQTDASIARALEQQCFLAFGELSLDGRLRKTPGLLAAGKLAEQAQTDALIVPAANAQEAVRFSAVPVYAVEYLGEILDFLRGRRTLTAVKKQERKAKESLPDIDFSDVRGQDLAKRALLVAAAGGHNVRMEGPPGAGKTLLAKAFAGILPHMDDGDVYAVSQIYSALGLLDNDAPIVQQRPFRSPHHTATAAALLGGGRPLKPGELTLAHHGVLFLDEFPEFDRRVLEALRQPLEEGVIVLSRAEGTERFPASFMLIAAHNPCPCGFAGDPERECVCSPNERARYKRKLSGPVLDRIDLHVRLPRLPYEELRGKDTASAVSSMEMREMVHAARLRQAARYAQEPWKTNGAIPHRAATAYLALSDVSEALLKNAMEKHQLSARAVSRILKVSRTIADLADEQHIQPSHLAEALQYRGVVLNA